MIYRSSRPNLNLIRTFLEAYLFFFWEVETYLKHVVGSMKKKLKIHRFQKFRCGPLQKFNSLPKMGILCNAVISLEVPRFYKTK